MNDGKEHPCLLMTPYPFPRDLPARISIGEEGYEALCSLRQLLRVRRHQLGKTALLHDVRAAFHSPEEGQLAEYVDLKAWDVGIAESPEHLWQVLWGALSQLGVVDGQAPMPRGRNRLLEKVEEEVERWLGESQDRRLLLLLDEADAFLEADLKEPQPVSRAVDSVLGWYRGRRGPSAVRQRAIA